MNRVTTVLGLAALLLFAATAVAGDGEHEHGKRGRGPGPDMMGMGDPAHMAQRMSRWLDLDELQQQEVDNILLAAQPMFQDIRERAHAARQAIEVYTMNGEGDIQLLALENGQIATDATLLMAQVRGSINDLLTPEQQEQLQEGATKIRERFRGDRRGKREPRAEDAVE